MDANRGGTSGELPEINLNSASVMLDVIAKSTVFFNVAGHEETLKALAGLAVRKFESILLRVNENNLYDIQITLSDGHNFEAFSKCVFHNTPRKICHVVIGLGSLRLLFDIANKVSIPQNIPDMMFAVEMVSPQNISEPVDSGPSHWDPIARPLININYLSPLHSNLTFEVSVDALTFVLFHECAHILRGHSAAEPHSDANLTRAEEVEADYYGGYFYMHHLLNQLSSGLIIQTEDKVKLVERIARAVDCAHLAFQFERLRQKPQNDGTYHLPLIRAQLAINGANLAFNEKYGPSLDFEKIVQDSRLTRVDFFTYLPDEAQVSLYADEEENIEDKKKYDCVTRPLFEKLRASTQGLQANNDWLRFQNR